MTIIATPFYRDDHAYDIIADLVGPSTADEIIFALEEEGFIIIPKEDETTPPETLPFEYTTEECERDMRKLSNGERGCANPNEHLA